ncbi:MAG: helix-turn-helix domain-containing protein [Candidatus Thermoplasmatota archaeon]|nr:helix-turn-helix domain-containing protein [Candidatus Thermoplasmatota archaeon]
MRKLIVEMKIHDHIKQMMQGFLVNVEELELIELIKVDFAEETKLVLSAITMQEGCSIDDLRTNEFVEMLSVLKQEGNKYICLSKARFLRKFSQMHHLDYDQLTQDFSFDVVWSTPTRFSHDTMVCSVIGTEENLKRFLKAIGFVGEITQVSFKTATYSEHALLSCLTEKQKHILIAANKHGYYSYPRRISSEELAKKVGLSKPTVVQHLRKAEVRLIENILAGY